MSLSEIPVGDLLFLSNCDEFVVVLRSDREGVDAAHALSLS